VAAAEEEADGATTVGVTKLDFFAIRWRGAKRPRAFCPFGTISRKVSFCLETADSLISFFQAL
jgi:hypothetical protein